MEYNLPKIYLLSETFSNLRHDFYDVMATTYLQIYGEFPYVVIHFIKLERWKPKKLLID